MFIEIISATIAGVLAGLAIQGIRAFRIGGLRKIRVFEPKDGQLNSKFYDHFLQQIERATDEILITGEGFEYKGKNGPKTADAYHNSIRTALEHGVNVTRIQTARPLNPRWADRLKELLQDYRNSFHLYIVDNQDYQDIASACVIDADRKGNVVEFMLSVEKDLEDSTARLASTAVFLHGRRDLARALKANILAMRHFAMAKKCETEADVDAFLGK